MSRSTQALKTFHESFGIVSKPQLSAYKKHNVSPSDHDYLVDTFGHGEHALITSVVKDARFHQGTSFSTFLHAEHMQEAAFWE